MIILFLFSQVSAMMDKFEKQFEQLDVQTQVMDETMSASTTLTVPQVKMIVIEKKICRSLNFGPNCLLLSRLFFFV